VDKILLRFIDICRLRAGPQDLPTSKVLMSMVLLAYGLLVVMLTADDKGLDVGFQVAIVATLTLAGLAYIVLWVRDFTERYVQLLTAMAGCGVLLELVRWPLVLVQQYGVDGGGNFFVVIGAVLLWGLLVWEVVIIASIFKHGLDTSMWMGGIISCFYVFLSFRVMRTLFFAPEVTTAVPVT